MSREETCLLARRQSVFRQHELSVGFGTERENAVAMLYAAAGRPALLALDAKGNDKWQTP